MILSYNWLKELTGTALSPRDLADTLTRVGLNVEEVSPAAAGDFALNADITTNRPDWLCHRGVAHEIAAIERRTLAFPDPAPVATAAGPAVTDLTSVTPLPGSEEACPRYTIRVIRNVKVGPSPEWLQNRLAAIGQRSINNVVDVTNLVCFEMNQPLHAFDMDKLAEGRIVLRMAEKGEAFAAITGESAKLEPDMLVIADAEKAVALAGVKGGANTEVGFETVNVLLESAWFQPRFVRRAARRARMSSESSYRYERGIDPGMTERASARAAELILELAGGQLARGVIDTNPALAEPWDVAMRFSRTDALLGVRVEPDEAVAILNGLGLDTVSRDGDRAVFRAPTFRRDLTREADLIEEVIRLAGYDRIPETITMPLALAHDRPETVVARTARRTLVGLGYHECITDAFVPGEWCAPFAPGAESYAIRNPINAERPVMRAALAPSLLEVRRTNRLADDVRLFEIGRAYRKTPAGPEEPTRLALVDDRGVDFVRGALETVVRELGVASRLTVRPDDAWPGAAPGSGAVLYLDDAPFAHIGLLADSERARFDLTSAPAFAEAEMEMLYAAPRRGRAYQPLPRFPGVRRDISVAVPEAVRWSEVEAVVRKSADAGLLDSLTFESLYRGKGLKPDTKALAFAMTLRSPERSLTDAEANAVRDAVAAALVAAIPEAELR